LTLAFVRPANPIGPKPSARRFRPPASIVSFWIQRLALLLAAAFDRAEARKIRVAISESLFLIDTALIEN
jgi:hypothetical protein